MDRRRPLTGCPSVCGNATDEGAARHAWRSKQALPMVLAVVVAGALAYFASTSSGSRSIQASPPMPPAAPLARLRLPSPAAALRRGTTVVN